MGGGWRFGRLGGGDHTPRPPPANDPTNSDHHGATIPRHPPPPTPPPRGTSGITEARVSPLPSGSNNIKGTPKFKVEKRLEKQASFNKNPDKFVKVLPHRKGS